MQPNLDDVRRIVITALEEDIGQGDVTSNAIIPEHIETQMSFVAREPMVVCGAQMIAQVFLAIDTDIDFVAKVEDGTAVQAGTEIASVNGNARAILAGERVALNLLQRMSGVATETAKYVKAVEGTAAKILDTRKTMPGLRVLDKYAVRVGGGQNHRMRLDDAVLIKDNHIAVAGSVTKALEAVHAAVPSIMLKEIECDTLEQVKESLEAGATRLLLDNMTNEQLREAVALAKNNVGGKAECEASGNVNLETVCAIAETGVDYISVGRITHSVRNVDVGLDSGHE